MIFQGRGTLQCGPMHGKLSDGVNSDRHRIVKILPSRVILTNLLINNK